MEMGMCTAIAGPRIYEIKAGSATYRQNRHHLIPTNESPSWEDTALDQQIGGSEEHMDNDSSTPTSSNTSGM